MREDLPSLALLISEALGQREGDIVEAFVSDLLEAADGGAVAEALGEWWSGGVGGVGSVGGVGGVGGGVVVE